MNGSYCHVSFYISKLQGIIQPPPPPPSTPMSLSFESESEAGRRFPEAKLILNPPQVDLKVKAGSELVNIFLPSNTSESRYSARKTTRAHVSFYLNSCFEHKPVKMKEKRIKTTENRPRVRVRRAFLESKEHLVHDGTSSNTLQIEEWKP